MTYRWYDSHWQRENSLEVLYNDKNATGNTPDCWHIFLPSFKVFSEVQIADFTKPWQQLMPARALSFYVFLAQIRKYVLIFARSLQILHISVFPDSLGAAPCLALDVQTFCGRDRSGLIGPVISGPLPHWPHKFRGRHFGKLCFCTDECAAKVESLNV